MTATMNDAIVIHRQELVVSLSIGISIYPDDGVSIEQTLNRAELAVREAKTPHGRVLEYRADCQ
jgi:GGDEF domain-containing protein